MSDGDEERVLCSDSSDDEAPPPAPLAPWIPKQIRAFLGWVNAKLAALGAGDDVSVAALSDLSDGVALATLVRALVAPSTPMGRFVAHPRMKIQCVANLDAALSALAADGVRVTCDAEAVYAADVKMVLGLLWVIICKYQIAASPAAADASGDDGAADAAAAGADADGGGLPGAGAGRAAPHVLRSGKSAKADLLEWVNAQLRADGNELEISNFTSAFQDGSVLAALTARFAPGSTSFAALMGRDGGGDGDAPAVVVERVLRVAHADLGIPELVEADDVVNDPDSQSIMTYVSYFRGAEAALKKGKLAHSADEFDALQAKVAALEAALAAEAAVVHDLRAEAQTAHLAAVSAEESVAALTARTAALDADLASARAAVDDARAAEAAVAARLVRTEHTAALVPILSTALGLPPPTDADDATAPAGEPAAGPPDAAAASRESAIATAQAALSEWANSAPPSAPAAAPATATRSTAAMAASLATVLENERTVARASIRGVSMSSMLDIADRVKAAAVAARRAAAPGAADAPADTAVAGAPAEASEGLVVELHAREREVLETLLATGKVVLQPSDDLTAITGLDAQGNRAGPCCMYETLMHRVQAQVAELNAAYAEVAAWAATSLDTLGTQALELVGTKAAELAAQVEAARADAAEARAALALERERTVRAAQLFNGMEMFKNNLQLRLESTETSMEMMRKRDDDLNASSSGVTKSGTSLVAVAMQRKTKNRRTAIEQSLAEEVSQLTGTRRGAAFRFGFLLKREKRRKAWSSLWVTLDHSFLEYRNNKNDLEPRGRIGLDGCVVNDVPEDNTLGLPANHPHYLAFHLRLQNRKDYFFVGESISDVRDWKDAIKANITVNESLKTLVANARSCSDPRILDAFSSQDIELLALNHRPLGLRELVAVQIALSMSDHFYALRTISLRDASIGPSELAVAATAFGDSPTLTALDLSGNSLGDAGVATLCAALKSSSVCELALASNGVGNAGMEAVAELLVANTGLVWLDASRNVIGDAGMVALYAAVVPSRRSPSPAPTGPSAPHAAPTHVRPPIARSSSASSDLGASAESGACPGSDSDSGSGLGSSASASGSASSASSSSTAVSEEQEEASSTTGSSSSGSDSDSDSSASDSSGGVADDDDPKAAALAVVAATKPAAHAGVPIHDLNLAHNQIGDEGARALAQLISAPTALRVVARLSLEGNRIGEQGAVALADHAAVSQHLLTLNVSRNPVGPVGAEAIISLLDRNDYLQDLTLGELPIPVASFCDKLVATASATHISFPSLTVVRSAFQHPETTA